VNTDEFRESPLESVLDQHKSSHGHSLSPDWRRNAYQAERQEQPA
jgi:hypothetical protein